MKAIIEKIIVNYFGKFIQGIDKNKLSVDIFGGNFKLQNISLNQEFFDTLNTPFKLAFSSIGMLNLQAPLSKLSSAPVQCTLDNIYVIFQFKQKTTEMINQAQALLRKKTALNKYISEVFQNYLQKIKQDKKQDGMFAKLGKKIIDNLKLKVINVHVRFEEKTKRSHYAWGITLEEISFIPTDSQWKPTFIDRNAQGFKNQKLHKMMCVKNFKLYWESGQSKNSKLINSLPNSQDKQKAMSQMIQNQDNSIINITSKFKLVINPIENLQKPIYQLQIELNPIKFQLQRQQVSEMIDFAQKNIVKNQMIIRSITQKKVKKKIYSSQREDELKQMYQIYVKDHIENELTNKKNQEEIKSENLQPFIKEVQMEDLMIWTIDPVKINVKKFRQSEMKKKKRGWFGGQNQLNEDEIKQLQKFIEETFEQDKTSRPKDNLLFKINLTIGGGKFIFVDDQKNEQGQCESVEFQIGSIYSSISKSQNQSYMEINLEVDWVNLSLKLPSYQSLQPKVMNIIFNEQKNLEKQQKQKFIKLSYIKKVSTIPKPQIRMIVEGYVQRLIVTYKKFYLMKFKQFFTFNNVHQYIKNSTIQKIQQIAQDQTEKIVQDDVVQKLYEFHMDIISPMFICPLNDNECWCLSLGNLQIRSQKQEKFLCYPMKITAGYLRYYPKIQWCYSDQFFQDSQTFSVINDLDFHLLYKKGKGSYVMDMKLPNFVVNFTEKQYHHLLNLKNIFKTDSGNQNILQTLKKQKEEIEAQAIYQGPISKKNETLNNWKDFHGILSGPYIYLYHHKKQLRFTDKINIKNSRLTIQQDQTLQLISQNQDCLFKCQNIQAIKKWKRQIQNKMKQYKTIYQLMDYIEEESHAEIDHSIHHSAIKTAHLLNNRIKVDGIIKLNINHIGFKFENEKKVALMQVSIHELNVQRSNLQKQTITKVQLSKLSIIDKLHIYDNSQYQQLLSAQKLMIEMQKKVKIRQNREKTKNISVNVKLPYLKINWKPDVLIMLLKLSSQHLKKEKEMRIDDEQQFNRNNVLKQIFADSKYSFTMKQYMQNGKNRFVKQNRQQYSCRPKGSNQILKVQCTISEMNLNFIHRQSHVVMFKAVCKQSFTQFSMGQTQKFVSGSLKNLQVYETMGYPQPKNSNQKIKPFRIISPKRKHRAHDQKEACLTYKFTSYEPLCLPNEQRVDSFLELHFAPFQLIYFQQVTMRVIDYALIQIILLIQQPQMLTVNQGLLEQIKNKNKSQIKQKPVTILFSEYEQIIKKIICPYFIDMYFTAKNPSIIIMSEKNSQTYYEADVQSLTFENKNKKDSKRFMKCECQDVRDYIYEQQFTIKLNNVNLQVVGKLESQLRNFRNQSMINAQNLQKKKSQQKVKHLFGPIQLDLIINKLMLQDFINAAYPEINTYDRSFKTASRCSEIKLLNLSREQYLSINKLLNFNILYEDQQDQLYIHNFKITKLLSPKPIIFDLSIPLLQIEAYVCKDVKLFSAQMDNFRLMFKRNKDLNCTLQIWMGQTHIKGFQKKFGLQPQQISSQEAQIMIPKNQYLQHDLLCIKCEGTQAMDILIQMRTTGEKVINMNVKQLQLSSHIGLLEVIFEWALPQDWIFPVKNLWLNQITFFATVHKMVAYLREDVQSVRNNLLQKFKQQIFHKASQSQIFDNIDKNMRAIQMLGVLCFKFNRKKGTAPQVLSQKLIKGQLKIEEVESLPQISFMTLILNTEVYHCFASAPEKGRKILQKFTLNLLEKRFLKVADPKKMTLKTIANRNLNIDKSHLKISFTDILLFQSLLEQIKKERQYVKHVNQILSKPTLSPLQILQETELSSLQNLEIQIEMVSIYIINNFRQRFVPVMRVHYNAINLTICNTFKKQMLQGNLEMSLSYFNTSIFRWEPVVEKTKFDFHLLKYFQQKKTIISLQFSRPVLINVSREMLLAVKQTLAQYKRSFTSIRSIDNEPIQFISHYVVRNETGYPIQIYNAQRVKKYEIQHGQQIDYRYQIDEYDEEKQENLMIGVKINHKKNKLMKITNIRINPHKQFHVVPIGIQGQTFPDHCKIVFRPQIKNSKKYLFISSCKKIINIAISPTRTSILPFDHDEMITLKQFNYKVSLFKELQDRNGIYKFLGKDGTLTITKKYLVYNYSPIPLKICSNVVLPNDFVGISEKLTINGVSQKETLLKVKYNDDLKQIYLYCEAYIVDYFGLAFNFGQSRYLDSYSFKGQLNSYKYTIYILPSAQSKFYVKIRQSKKWSQYRPGLGKTIVELVKQGSVCEFSFYHYIIPHQNEKVREFKNIIEITPEYVIENSTKNQIKVSQVNSSISIILKPFERVPFFWESQKKDRCIKVATYDGKTFWGYSGPMQIQRTTQSVILRNGADPTSYKILTCQVQKTSTITFLHIMETAPKFVISNKVPYTTVSVYQQKIFQSDLQFNPKQFIFNVGYKQEKPFGYELPNESHRLVVNIDLQSQNPDYKNLRIDPIAIDDFQLDLFQKKVDVYSLATTKDKSGKEVKVKKLVRSMKLILQYEINNVKQLKFLLQRQQQNEEQGIEFIAKIPHIGVSLIGMDKSSDYKFQQKVRKQLLHIVAKNLQIQIQKNNFTTDFGLELGSLRVQNQLHYNVQFPILMQSVKNEAGFCLSFFISRDSKNSHLIHQFVVVVGRFVVTVTSEEIQVFQNNILDFLNIKMSSDDGSNQLIRDYELFRQEKLIGQENMYFIQAQISPFKSQVTFRHVNQWGGRLLQTFGSINQCKIALNGKKILNFSCKNLFQLFLLVLTHYKQGLKQNLFSYVGNLSILGSPMVLVNRIGSGVKDLIQLPSQGFQVGAIEGGIGIAKGARSLLSNTFQGTFNSLESISGSIGNGLSTLVDDQGYTRKRQRIKNQRSENIVDGLKNGAKSIGNGFQKGFTGLFKKPVEGVQKDGVFGLFTGSVKGLAGLVVKPITGVLDATSKTAQGIKNSATGGVSSKSMYIRTHNPRPFYYYCKQFRQYDEQLAYCMRLLQEEDNQKFSNLRWAGFYFINKGQNTKKKPMLFVTYEYLIFYEINSQSLLKVYNCEEMTDIQLANKKIILTIAAKKNNFKAGKIDFEAEGSPLKIRNELDAIRKYYRPTYRFE